MGRHPLERRDPYAELTRLIWKQRLKTAVRIGLFVIPLLVLLIAYYADPIESPTHVIGFVVGLHQAQSEVPSPPQFIVQLDSGQTVIASGAQRALFRKNRRAPLSERRTMILGRRSYSFVRYLEDEESVQD